MSRFVQLVLLVLVFSPDMSFGQVANYRPQVGKPHPDFILPSIEDGSKIQLSDFRGKKVLLMHFASW